MINRNIDELDKRPTIIELYEYEPCYLPKTWLSEEEASILFTTYRSQIQIDVPSLLNGHRWCLKSLGWIGHLPLTPTFSLSLQPKIKISNVFRMIEVAYGLEKFNFLDGLYSSKTVQELYEILSLALAKRILLRMRRGIYRTYQTFEDELPFVRGAVDYLAMSRRPSRIALPCNFEEHTADIEENRLIAWTLAKVLRSGLCTLRSLPVVRSAYQELLGFADPSPFSPDICLDRHYHRLNADYEGLHHLCYFLLSDYGPSHEWGEQKMIPFLINMNSLYERYVAEWLRLNLPPHYTLHIQDHYVFSTALNMSFKIDLVVSDVNTGKVCWVMDTKYKTNTNRPETDDLHQIVSYAAAKHSLNAVLIFPIQMPSLTHQVGDIRIRTLTYAVDGDLDVNGKFFIESLGI